MKQKFLLLMTLVFASVFLVSAQMFEQVTSTVNVGDVYYMTNESAGADGIAYDQDVIDDLESAGFNLTLGYPEDDGKLDVVELNNHDLVVVGRNISSSQFKVPEYWDDVEAPVMILSGYLVRNSRLKYIDSGSLKREVDSAINNQDRITRALVDDTDEFVFKGLVDADDKMDYMTWFYDYLAYDVDTFKLKNNGKVLASIVDAELEKTNGSVLMSRWEPGVETYAGSGVTPKSYRTYLQMGGDDKSDPKNMNYAQYTKQSLSLMINEMNFLIRTGKTVQYITRGDVDADSVAYDQQVIDDLGNAGYTNLVQTYPEDDGSFNTVDYNDSDLILVGRNISSSQFKDPAHWDNVEAPVMILSGYLVRNSRLKYIDSSSLKREADSAINNQDRITKALVADVADSSFMGVSVGADSKMDYMTWFYDYLAYDIDTFKLKNNGKVLASIVDAELEKTNGSVLMARWAPGVETYAGSGVTPKSYRTYMQMGADDKSDPKNMNYAQYTDASFQLMVNELTYLSSTYAPAGIVLGDDATLASLAVSEGTLDPAFTPEVVNYTVELGEDATAVPTVTVTAADTNAVVEITDAAEVPGSTIIKVTSEDKQNVMTYIVAFSKPQVGDIVPPGMGTLEAAVMAAEDGATLVLENGGQYDIISPIVIDKTITIKAEEAPELPALENMPIISNMFLSTQVFSLKTNCDLSLIGIDVDGLGGSHIFDPMQDSNHTVSLYVNRCRLHNTIDDILNDDASYKNNITMAKLHILNSFIYDNGSGHGIYTKHFNTNGSPWKFENITMWNLGQQFTWIRVMNEGTQDIVFDHMTGYNLSTSSDDKELFGNDEKTAEDADPEADLVINFKNNILSTQVSANDGSLIFKNSDGFHNITINNNVLHAVKPMANIGTVTETDNLIDSDPQFVDPDNGDFTVGNADLLTAADDGKIVGALYWAPDFVDDFSDLETGIKEFKANSNIKNVVVYPNPFTNAVNLAIELTEGSNVELTIFNIEGQAVTSVGYGELSSGTHELNCNTNEFNSGVYFYQIMTEKGISTGKIVKN